MASRRCLRVLGVQVDLIRAVQREADRPSAAVPSMSSAKTVRTQLTAPSPDTGT
jgi:hypothetical protein